MMIGHIVLAAICPLATGCTVPLFEHPLESPDAATIPPRLFGVYKQVDGPDNVAGYLHIGPAGAETPPGVFRFLSISQPLDETTPLKASRGFGIATRVGEYHVLQIPVHSGANCDDVPSLDYDAWDHSAVAGFIFARLDITDEHIKLSYIDSGFVESAIEDGRLHGTVERSEKIHTLSIAGADGERVNTTMVERKTEAILVTADSCTLRPFLLESIDSGMFSGPSVTFKRND